MVFCKEIDGENVDLSTLFDISGVDKGEDVL